MLACRHVTHGDDAERPIAEARLLGRELAADARAILSHAGDQEVALEPLADALGGLREVLRGDSPPESSRIEQLLAAVTEDLAQPVVAVHDDSFVVDEDALERRLLEEAQALLDPARGIVLRGPGERDAQGVLQDGAGLRARWFDAGAGDQREPARAALEAQPGPAHSIRLRESPSLQRFDRCLDAHVWQIAVERGDDVRHEVGSRLELHLGACHGEPEDTPDRTLTAQQ